MQIFSAKSLIGLKSLAGMSLSAVAVVATPASAQDAPAADSAHVDKMRECSGIANDGARLACYDAASASLLADFDDGSVRLVRTEEIEQTRRSVFGFSLPTITLFGGKDDDGEDVEPLDTLTSTITRVSRIGEDSYRFTIEEGDAVWEVRDAPARFRMPKVGDSVEFERASLGSYWVRVNGAMGAKGKRVQ